MKLKLKWIGCEKIRLEEGNISRMKTGRWKTNKGKTKERPQRKGEKAFPALLSGKVFPIFMRDSTL